MNDKECLEWVAEHLKEFSPLFQSATMVYIDDEGYTKKVSVQSDWLNPSSLDLLQQCINLASMKI